MLLVFFYASNIAFYGSNCQKARKTGKNALDKKIMRFAFAACFCCCLLMRWWCCIKDIVYSPARVDGTACVGWYFMPRTDTQRGGAGSLKYIPPILTFLQFWNIDRLFAMSSFFLLDLVWYMVV